MPRRRTSVLRTREGVRKRGRVTPSRVNVRRLTNVGFMRATRGLRLTHSRKPKASS